MSLSGDQQEEQRPEIIIALVGPTATDLDEVYRLVEEALLTVGYSAEEVRLSDLLDEVEGGVFKLPPSLPPAERIGWRMTQGNVLCEAIVSADAMARLAVVELSRRRTESLLADEPALADLSAAQRESALDSKRPLYMQRRNHAYVLRSLKRPEEVNTLRLIYGPWLVLVGASRSSSERARRFMAEMQLDDPLAVDEDLRRKALKLIDRDRDEATQNRWGQNVGSTFPMADFFVDTSNTERMNYEIRRFVELIFGYRFWTPRKPEQAMMQAYVSALRSSSWSRQVGTAIVDTSGVLLATGCNDVGKAGGGLYWEEDDPNGRDHCVTDREPSRERRDLFLADVLRSLKAWTNPEIQDRIESGIAELVREAWDGPLQRSRLNDVTEYQRAVHAEMAALSDAACRGISVREATLYTTTFPCHVCAKHIVAAGIERVFYIEPYPKSLVNEFYPDSIALEDDSDSGRVPFRPFEGIAPRRFHELFLLDKQERARNGQRVRWHKAKRSARPLLGIPRTQQPATATILGNETDLVRRFHRSLQQQSVMNTLEERGRYDADR